MNKYFPKGKVKINMPETMIKGFEFLYRTGPDIESPGYTAYQLNGTFGKTRVCPGKSGLSLSLSYLIVNLFRYYTWT